MEPPHQWCHLCLVPRLLYESVYIFLCLPISQIQFLEAYFELNSTKMLTTFHLIAQLRTIPFQIGIAQW